MTGVLLTGGTGNVGSRLVREYLTATDATLYLLVRADNDAAAAERVDRVLSFWDVAGAEYRSRVRVLRGDILSPDLGLSPVLLEEIRREVTEVLHAASNLRLDLTVERARHEILGGTKNVFGIAARLERLDRFGYLSTMEVMGHYKGDIREEFLTHHRVPFLNNYEVAKFESEEFLRERVEAGVPITIYRISMVVGEAATGKLQDFQSFYMLAEKLVLKPDFPVLPDGAPIDAIPIDFLARSIVTTMRSPSSAGRIYHLSQGQDDAITFRRFREVFKPIAESHLGRPLRRTWLVPVTVHRTLFKALAAVTFGKLKRFFRVQLIFLQFFDLPGRFVNEQTKRELGALGLQWPRFQDYLPRLMQYYFQHRHENRLPF